MLLGYGGKNCWSFKEWLEVDLTVNKKASSNDSFKDTNVLPLLNFTGANASGKSIALKVLTFIFYFCRNSFELKPKSIIPYESFFDNEEDSEFYLKFEIDNEIFLYELVLNKNIVKSEKLTNVTTRKRLFSRKESKVNISSLVKDNNRLLVRDNVSLFSTAFQYEIIEFKKFYDFFSRFNSNLFLYGTRSYSVNDEISQFYFENETIKERVVKELIRFDTGITDVKIIKAKNNDNTDVYYSEFHHNASGNDETLPLFSQSMGTRILYNMLANVFTNLDNGGVMVLDEIDEHLHPDITVEIINYYLDKETNPHNAQLLFSCHDQKLLDITKKYRSYIFAKEDSESLCYRIDELPNNVGIRNDRPLSPLYENRVLGGRPNVKK